MRESSNYLNACLICILGIISSHENVFAPTCPHMLPHIPGTSHILFVEVLMHGCLAAFSEALKLVVETQVPVVTYWPIYDS
ncbi:hypothetical protein BDR03DRAFT_1012906 [Suillus americanus]|nr:hypothetical protein BDR03DRAFT_1012906 [Suillus americanus]